MASSIMVFVDGKPMTAHPGETVLSLLFAAGKLQLGQSRKTAQARGCLCGMGVCYECQVTIDGRSGERACMILVREGMEVVTDEA
ncbi:MAG: (2Fe-2S)-binding protein [Deltaproteobacteria bacterium]|nr:(2Fe-2S)-binding protein [Deltaproteobacteria bacterium]